MNQKKKILLITIAIIVVAFLIFKLIFHSKESSKITIETSHLEIGNIENIVTATGTIEPIKQVEVGTQVSGVVQKIYVDFNSKVKAGELIAELDKTNLRASLSVAQTNYETAQNELNYVKKIYERQKSLFEKQVISQVDLDQAQYNLVNAQGNFSQRKSDLEKAVTNLSYADIKSPIDGVILSRTVDVGQTVAASFNTPTLFTIAQDLTKMQVEADVDEADIGKVKIGQRVEFTVDAFQDKTFYGKVTQIRLNPTVTSNVVTYTVIIDAENPDQKLMPGLTAIITIFTQELTNVSIIPIKAIDFKPDSAIYIEYARLNHIEIKKSLATSKKHDSKEVWVKKNNIIEPRIISVGSRDEINIQVLSGISKGEEIVLDMKKEELSIETPSGSPFMPKRPIHKTK
jgi:HlyD family secretion protein